MAGERKQRKPSSRGPRVMSTVTSVRFPVALLEKLNTEAEARGIYTTALINEVLTAHVNRPARKRAEPASPATAALFG